VRLGLALVLPALLAVAMTASAQEATHAHMEGCLIWSGSGAVATRNECSRPIALQFMTFDDQQVTTIDLPPGGRFISDVQWGESGGFLFTACPLGYRPNVRFALENKDVIGPSLYNCIGGRPSS
jgi:hypothetical protein